MSIPIEPLNDRTDPPIAWFAPISDEWDPTANGITIYDPRTPPKYHWIESDHYVHLETAR